MKNSHQEISEVVYFMDILFDGTKIDVALHTQNNGLIGEYIVDSVDVWSWDIPSNIEMHPNGNTFSTFIYFPDGAIIKIEEIDGLKTLTVDRETEQHFEAKLSDLA